jgi:CTD kinase subunit beta
MSPTPNAVEEELAGQELNGRGAAFLYTEDWTIDAVDHAQLNFYHFISQAVVMASANPSQAGGQNPNTAPNTIGPHPSYIQVAKPFLFQQQLQNRLVAIGTNPTREDAFRLQGVQWINEIRTTLQL